MNNKERFKNRERIRIQQNRKDSMEAFEVITENILYERDTQDRTTAFKVLDLLEVKQWYRKEFPILEEEI